MHVHAYALMLKNKLNTTTELPHFARGGGGGGGGEGIGYILVSVTSFIKYSPGDYYVAKTA